MNKLELVFVLIVSVFTLFIPLMIYLFVRSGKRCRKCGKKTLVPLSSPVARMWTGGPPARLPGRSAPVAPQGKAAAVSSPCPKQSTGWGAVGDWMASHPVWTILILLFVVGALSRSLLNEGPTTTVNQQPSVTQASQAELPQIPPPKFRLFKSGTDQQTTYIVPANTSDEQLKSLLWFFRTKVRTGDFKAIGITQPTAKQWGKYGYTSGMLVVYRGTKCANEGYDAEKGHVGPCGYGEHDDSYYQWGVDGDPYKDEGGIADRNGTTKVVFDFKDNWHAPSEGLQGVSAGMKEEWNAKQQEWEPRQRFAVQMTNVFNEKGIDVQASANEASPTQLDFRSQQFAKPAFQESFINEALPQARRDLCNAGFRSIRVLQGTASGSGRIYPLQCQ